MGAAARAALEEAPREPEGPGHRTPAPPMGGRITIPAPRPLEPRAPILRSVIRSPRAVHGTGGWVQDRALHQGGERQAGHHVRGRHPRHRRREAKRSCDGRRATISQGNEGNGGYTIANPSSKGGIAGAITDQSCSTYKPNIILLMIGTNDILQNIDLATPPPGWESDRRDHRRRTGCAPRRLVDSALLQRHDRPGLQRDHPGDGEDPGPGREARALRRCARGLRQGCELHGRLHFERRASPEHQRVCRHRRSVLRGHQPVPAMSRPAHGDHQPGSSRSGSSRYVVGEIG